MSWPATVTRPALQPVRKCSSHSSATNWKSGRTQRTGDSQTIVIFASEDGDPILTPVEAAPDPEGLDHALSLIKEQLEPIEILDAFVDTEHWLNWTRHFGPISGLESKLKRARERYLLTVFCYGCNLGPVQTARSVRGVNRFQLAFINQRHITEQFLNDAITTIVNAYVQFPLQSLWGTGRSASADGMKWDLYPQNLMAEYHIRYGGYGGVGYYLVADNYIAADEPLDHVRLVGKAMPSSTS